MKANEGSAYPDPRSRPLKVFAFDPSLGRQFSNHMTIHLPYEPVGRGPVGRKVAVVDWDFSCETFYEAVDLNDPWVLMNGGLDPAEGDPRFHQQMAYAVVSETVARFESALGREIQWGRAQRDADEHKTLRVFPHAFQMANAFYHPQLCALLFGYFTAEDRGSGAQRVFTCLSHDIIAHETTHAVLDSLRRHFAEPTGPDTLAFHEAFADIVALFLHFSVEDAVFDTIRRTGGQLFKSALDPLVAGGGKDIRAQMRRENPLVGLAQQFGHGLGRRKALRQALGEEPDPKRLAEVTEPHDRGAILVAAVFDAFFTAYVNRTRDLMRLAATGSYGPELHHDLARRLTAEATKTASHFLDICIRAIDYCPPVDIRFGEFLRAMITADRDLVPDDRHDYRGALIEAFQARGIHADDVPSFSEDLLAWEAPQQDMHCEMLFKLTPDGETGSAVGIEIDYPAQMSLLEAFAVANAGQLGLRKGFKPWSIQPIRRIAPDGRLQIEFAVEFVETHPQLLDPADFKGPTFPFHGGAAVIFNAHGDAKYTIRKSAGNTQRLKEQRQFRQGMMDGWACAPFIGGPLPDFHFGMVHGGM
ncbi:MAG: hypothetical protein ACM31L_02690 [Actinomycetota bacterium]